ncbi:UPF0182 family protein [Phycicoccus endophyticus]|uniref:UPF0182 protein H9L10_09150 n=1 Tax=Phycicoccus endophyticus TaxID=1690220 RepID=A0A7G9QYS6_9MICO|nr:UPF0182 family protein [Phycicoccus endophyticus]NHI20461.1 UPF0182 family protein [Phycicoccus endophyticus]QNN48501.1 UPF0182 family protein [Phycicoccus endophyticus]GGL30574.1 UPF0182 protein [Phycicoccus endophyticus]
MSRSDWFDGPTDPDEGGRPAGDGGAGAPPRPVLARRRGPLLPTVLVLIVLAVLAGIGADLLTDVWWYDSVGYRDVFVTELTTKVVIFAVAALVTAGAVAASLVVAFRTRPVYVPVTQAQQVLEQYRQAIEPLRRIALVAIPAVLGLLAGSGSMGAWKTYLLWANAVPFGVEDPQFHLDVGFFVFTLPWLRFLVGFVTVVLVLAFLAGAFTHYVYGGLQLPGRGPSTRAAYVHLGVLGALTALTRAASYWLDRYSRSTEKGSLLTGITYTDANAVLPTKAILAVAAVMTAGFFLAAIWSRSWRLPVIGVALLVVTAVVAGTIYPALIQSLRVRPSEKSLEATYIERNITATSAAFGLDRVERIQNEVPEEEPSDASLRTDAEEIPGVRIIDPNVVAPTFRQLEGERDFYAFPDTLDVDRYTIDGTVSDAVVAVREMSLDGLPDSQRNWINDHTVYTHGYGFYAAYGNQRTAEGDPVFFEGGGRNNLGDYEPRIYFGELSPQYSVVGQPEGADDREFDYPAGTEGEVAVQNTYTGGGGVGIGSMLRRVAYAVKYREANFLLSDAVNGSSRILDHRTPQERVERVAPWLQLDGNVYPAVVDGRVQWIVDGFTTSADYPNSRLLDLADATSDSVAERSNVVQVRTGEVNYVRNAVKATVDAYDGSVTLYGWDTSDPLLQAWSKAFPGSVRPLSEISGDLMSHIRYPQDLLKVQRDLLTEYHVTNPGDFFSGSDRWRVPRDPSQSAQDQPVVFQSIKLPGEDSASFSITSPFVPASNTEGGREILRGLLAVDAEAGSTAGKPAEDFGKLRLVEYSSNQAPSGPGQIRNQIQNSTTRSQNPAEPLNLAQYITNNSGQGKTLTFGNLLTFPLAGRTFYVQPIYVQASSGSGSFPQNKVTVAVYGTNVAWGDTLEQAVTGLFGESVGGSGGGSGGDTGDSGGGGPDQPSPDSSLEQQLAAAIGEIQQAYADGQEALSQSDFAAYGEAQDRLDAAIEKAQGLADQLGVAAPSSSASPSPSASASAGSDSG